MVRGVDTAAAVLPLRKKDANQPDAGRLIVALRQIGYSLEQAIADLIDNSVNAGARNVLVRMLHDGDQIRAIAVADDGSGMSEEALTDAMRFGSRERHDPTTLGKFGMGMKLASMSHARQLSVFSRSDGSAAARRWTLEGIASGWWCDRLVKRTAASMLDRSWGAMNLSQAGTVVLWEDIDRLPSHRSGLRYTLALIERRLRLHLGLCFHRFLESDRLTIWLDQILINRIGQGLQSQISALNPFGYPISGDSDYPKSMIADLTDIGQLELEAHIWPAHSELSEYRLGRRAAARQGFYFYRNGRLIQAGGWNGLVSDDTEPHSSLARVAIDLPIQYDEWFGINVQKSNVLAPPVFADVLAAVAADGTTFEDYRRTAVDVYRNANKVEQATAPYPARGLPRDIRCNLRELYARDDKSEGFSVKWRRLRVSEYFRLDSERSELLLNSLYKEKSGRRTASEDMVKLLLSILLKRDFQPAMRKSRAKELSALNAMLISLADQSH